MTGEGKLPVKGSLPYMSPELIVGQSRDPFANDIWALGITFYQLMIGRLPWTSSDKSGITREISKAVISLPLKLEPKVFSTLNAILREDPNARPTAEQILQMPGFEIGKDTRRGSLSSLATIGSATLSLTSGRMVVGPQRVKGQRKSNHQPQYDVCVYNPDADLDKLGLRSIPTEVSVNHPR
jgi:serine/threonine protein kinase